MYLAVGWAALVAMPIIVRELSPAGAALLLASGATFTVGAVIHAMRRPNPLPRVFGHHEIFHVATVVGTALLFLTIDLHVFGG
jgi:hemolysin III